MAKTHSHGKNQNFVLFWLGLLTGALLVVALYSAGGSSDDLSGQLRAGSFEATSSTQYTYPKYKLDYSYKSEPIYTETKTLDSYGTMGGDNYGDMGGDNYGYNSLMHVEDSPLSREEYKVVFDDGFRDASYKRYEVGKYATKVERAAYDDGFNSYGTMGGDNYGDMGGDNYGYNSLLHLEPVSTLSSTEYKKVFDVGYKDASYKRYEVGKYATKAERVAYDDGYYAYGTMGGDNYGTMGGDNYGY